MRVAALLCLRNGPLNFHRAALDRFAGFKIKHFCATHSQNRIFIIFQIQKAVGVRQKGRHIARKKSFLMPESDHERVGSFESDKLVGLFAADQRKGKIALHAFDSFNHGLDQACGPGIITGDQVDRDLGIGLRVETKPLGFKLFFQSGIIFNNAIMNDGQPFGVVQMRMGIEARRLSVRGPARMPQAGVGRKIPASQQIFQGRQLPLLLDDLNGMAIPLQTRDACGVIAAVLQMLQSLDEH